MNISRQLTVGSRQLTSQYYKPEKTFLRIRDIIFGQITWFQSCQLSTAYCQLNNYLNKIINL
jgi:hypothetical protein